MAKFRVVVPGSDHSKNRIEFEKGGSMPAPYVKDVAMARATYFHRDRVQVVVTIDRWFTEGLANHERRRAAYKTLGHAWPDIKTVISQWRAEPNAEYLKFKIRAVLRGG